MPSTVIVTGGCGFIGSHVVSLLRRELPDWRVVVLDKLTYAANAATFAELLDAGAELICADVVDAPSVMDLFEAERPDYVVHMAAESHVDRSILDSAPFLQTNVLGTQVMLEAARRFGVERFLYVSTDEVYGDTGHDGAPCSELSPLRASSPYAASKAAADLLVQAYHRTYGLPVLIARPCNHYGPRQFPEKLIPFMLRNLLEDKPLPVYGNGLQERDWLFVEDGARALLDILLRGQIGCSYNIAAHQDRTNIEVITRLCQLFSRHEHRDGFDINQRLSFVADRPGHDVRYALDDRYLREETGWRPTVGFEEGLARTVAWYLAHRDWLDGTPDQATAAYYDAVYARQWEGVGASTKT
jgi:dTDP-glucose 4,6-dehydratase